MLEPNTVLQDRYRIVSLIAQGGMGVVYQAVDQRLGNTVALKETFFNDEMLLKAFEREARLLAGLRHSSLPVVSDHFSERDGQFLVMEYIPGDDLGAILKKRKEEANGSEYVLPSYGKRGHIVEVKSAWKRIIEAAKLEDLRPHDLRRTLGSYMAIQGASLNIIGATLGHSQPQTTQVYARLTNNAVADGVNKAAGFIETTAKPTKKAKGTSRKSKGGAK